MDAWTDFAVAVCGAAAALAGLVLVAVSVNVDRILELPGVPLRAIEALEVLLIQLALCIALLTPGQSERDVALVLIAIGAIGWVIVLGSFVRSVNQWDLEHPMRAGARLVLNQLATLPVIVAGVSLWLGDAAGMRWLMIAAIFSFVVAITNAWVLLIEIKR